ncbi:uncharacterized protein EI90DRAFT_3151191 [Cantharellus anzutake]|uniref:uncharacterized protein n=1 Tax=Cantharellus anzutake TaxID=1750568 RepID=UPI0019031C4D|nr:uncharacterized protein EI90DRAFT_3151191 [Cantharellus anzutake]KAF8339719.1 hypothetical protein EI90DRAFT_3151191 [Cantharellus anzutake]
MSSGEVEFDLGGLSVFLTIAAVLFGTQDHSGGALEIYTAQDIQTGERPFHGVNVTCSAVSNKGDLFRFVEELGGTSSLDLIDSTTHLITHGPGSEKYKYALEHGIPLIHPDWIMESHARFVNGEDIDAHQLLNKYHLKCFQGLNICVAGEDKLEQRHRMAQIIEDQGGCYSKDVDQSVTHLILCGSINAPLNSIGDIPLKVQEAMWINETRSTPSTPYNFPRKRKYGESSGLSTHGPIQIVWSEWLWDCAYARGRFDEKLYDATVQARPEPRKFPNGFSEPEPSFSAVSTSTPKGQFMRPHSDTNVDENTRARASKTHTYAQSNLWTKIKQQKVRSKEILPDGQPKAGEVKATTSAPTSGDATRGMTVPKTALSRVSGMRTFEIGEPGPSSEPRDSNRVFNRVSSRETAPTEAQIFSGFVFGALVGNHGRSDVLKREIQARGGRFLTGMTPSQALEMAHFVIVPLTSTAHVGIENEQYKSKLRTESWLEHCIFEDRVDKFRIAYSGLNNMETTYLKRFARAIGLDIPEIAKRNLITHMVCPSRMGQKYEKAVEWRIPVVNLEWVYNLAIQPQDGASFEPAPVIDITNEMITQDELPQNRSPSRTRSSRAGHDKVSTPRKPMAKTPERLAIPQTPTSSRTNASSNVRPTRSPGLPRAPRGGINSPASKKLQSHFDGRRSATPSNMVPSTLKLDISTPKKSRSESVVPSSQSPSPFKSPMARAVRDQLASILGGNDEFSGQESSNPDRVSLSASTNSNNPPRKKARPIPRHKATTPDGFTASRSGSMNASSGALSIPDLDPQQSWSKFEPRAEESCTTHYEIPIDDDSLRVQYLDPGQKAVKDQLMALVDGGDGANNHENTKGRSPKSSAKPGPTSKSTRKRGGMATRRSARKAGP